MNNASAKPARFWIPGLLALFTLVAFARLVTFGFVNYDDPTYIFHNARISAGLTPANVIWSFTTFYFNNWHPLTWLTYLTTSQFFGVHPAAFHGVNIFVHIANVVLLYFLLLRLTNRVYRSAVVAALFAVHPLHVESVAWISELKDVLSTCFMLLAIHAYVSFVKRKSAGPYLAMCALFAMGLMAKSMIVTLPFILLLLDYWPLQRLSKRVLLEKIPLFVLSAVTCIIAMMAQGTAVAARAHITVGARVANAAISYATYLCKAFAPIHLAAYYPHPAIVGSTNSVALVLSIVVLLLVTFVAVLQTKSRRYLLFGWLWFLGTLVPVIGIVQVGEQAMADRYTYVPLIGLFIGIVWLVGDLFPRSSMLIGWMAVMACAIVTEVQIGYWRDTNMLFSHALAVTDSNYIALDQLAVDQIEHQQPVEAIALAEQSVRINPQSVYGHTILGRAYGLSGRSIDAVQAFHDAIEIDPDDAELRNNAGTALAAAGRADDAENQYNEALRLNPQSAVAHCNLAYLLASQGRLEEAINHWQAALNINPSYTPARQGLDQAKRTRSGSK